MACVLKTLFLPLPQRDSSSIVEAIYFDVNAIMKKDNRYFGFRGGKNQNAENWEPQMLSTMFRMAHLLDYVRAPEVLVLVLRLITMTGLHVGLI